MSLGIVLAATNHFTMYLVSLKRGKIHLMLWLSRRHKMTRIYIYEKERIYCYGLKVKNVKKGEERLDQNINHINTGRLYNFLPNDQ